MLTLFTSCKPFKGEDAVAQRNAIKSWMLLRPKPEILIMGDDNGTVEIAAEFNLRHVPDVQRSEFGNPLVSDLFLKAQDTATFDICCYINADIILLSNFTRGISRVSASNKNFLMVGRRYDLDVKEQLAFGDNWEEIILRKVKAVGNQYHLPGMDYFVFRKGQWPSIPPFVLGNLRWDNWMVREARRMGILTVDATDAITVVHQNHAMKHGEESLGGGIESDKAALYNIDLYGKNITAFFHLDATHVLTPTRVKRALSVPYLRRRLVTTAYFNPRIAPLCRFISKVIS